MTTLLSRGMPVVLVANQVYAVPSGSTQIAWQSAAGSNVLGSLDGVNFTSLGSRPQMRTKTVATSVAFIKSATTPTVVTKR